MTPEQEALTRRLVGRTIVSVNWADKGPFGHAVDYEQIEGMILDDGSSVTFQASGQIDVAVVWLDIEPRKT